MLKKVEVQGKEVEVYEGEHLRVVVDEHVLTGSVCFWMQSVTTENNLVLYFDLERANRLTRRKDKKAAAEASASRNSQP